MSYLGYISDEKLEEFVKYVLDKGIDRKAHADNKFNKNVIDPFGSLFEAAAFDINHKAWRGSEIIRQCQKTLQNHVGELHQKILGEVDGWQDLGKGSVIDLVCDEKKIIAEVKNKYNTVTGGKLADQYYSLERLVMQKSSKYRGYTAYFVNIIPKNPTPVDKCFVPSDKEKGAKCQRNEKIRVIDGASFYSIVTEDQTAITNFYEQLPSVIENIFSKYYKQPKFKIQDKATFQKYFDKAYIK